MSNKVVVLSGETGCGKTTQVLLYVLWFILCRYFHVYLRSRHIHKHIWCFALLFGWLEGYLACRMPATAPQLNWD